MNQLSAWYQSHPAQNTEPALRGTLAIAVRDWVDERLASGSFTRIARRHDSGWSEVLVEGDWYPARPMLGALELALQYGESVEGVMEEIAARCMPQLLRDTFAAQLCTQPTALLGQSQSVLRGLIDFGTVEAELNLQGLYEAWIHGIPYDLDGLVRGLWQGLAPALMACGSVKEARSAVVQCEQGVLGKRLYVRCRYR